MRRRRLYFILVPILLVLVLLGGFCLSVAVDEGEAMVDVQAKLDEIESAPGVDEATLRQLAYDFAFDLYADANRAQSFSDDLVALHRACQNTDFLLVYNTGGFGGGTMEDDPEWPGILEGMKEELAKLGHSAKIVEHQRGRNGLGGFADEIRLLRQDYRSKAVDLAAKFGFLTRFNPDVTVILTGRCFGGMLCNQAMPLLKDNPQILSVQAGIPFWYTVQDTERSLILENNGEMPDIVRSRNVFDFLWTLFRTNFGRVPTKAPPEEGGFKAIAWYLKAPGHTYTWEHEGVNTSITAFLQDNFGTAG